MVDQELKSGAHYDKKKTLYLHSGVLAAGCGVDGGMVVQVVPDPRGKVPLC